MTKDDIIRMAKEAGYKDLPAVRLAYQGFNAEHFAALVAAAERKALRDEMWEKAMDLFGEAVKYEREACAVMIENYALQYAEPVWALKITEAIRARSQS